MSLCVCYEATLGTLLHLDLMLELFGLLLHIVEVKVLLVQVNLFLALNVGHLVLQEVLHFLVLAEFEHLIALCLHAVLTSVLVDDLAPELVLLFLQTSEK